MKGVACSWYFSSLWHTIHSWLDSLYLPQLPDMTVQICGVFPEIIRYVSAVLSDNNLRFKSCMMVRGVRETMKKYLLVPVLTGMLLFTGCMLDNPTDPTPPSWILNLDVPLFKRHISLELFQDNSLISPQPMGASGDSIYALQDSFSVDTITVGNQLSVSDISKTYSQSVENVTVSETRIPVQMEIDPIQIGRTERKVSSRVGPIELEDTEPRTTDPFTFREIMPDSQVQQMEARINSSGGEATFDSIPGTSIAPVSKIFEFESFRTADFSSGYVYLTLHNEMFISLGAPLTVKLRQQDATPIDSAVYESPIPSGESATEVLNIGGHRLTDSVIVEVYGYSEGSAGEERTLTMEDLDSGFQVEVEARDLVVTSAEARIPSQTVQKSDAFALEESDNRFEEAKLSAGTLSLNIDNELDLNGDILLTISSLTDEHAAPFQRTIPMTANQSVHKEYDLTGHTLRMSPDQQEIMYNYEVRTEDTGDRFTNIHQNDSVAVDIATENITVSRFTGEIEQQDITINDQFSLQSDSEIRRANISEGSLIIRIDNQVGGTYTLELTLPEIYETPGGNDTLRRTIELPEGVTETSIPLDGMQVRFPGESQVLRYYIRTVSEPGVYATFDLTKNMNADIKLSEVTFSEVTGYFNRKPLVIRDTLGLNIDHKLKQATISSGTLTLNTINHLGVAADVSLIIPELEGPDGTQFETSLSLDAFQESSVKEISLKHYTLSLPIDSQVVHYESRVILGGDELMTINFDNSLQVDIGLQNLRFHEIQGILDPITMDIGPIEREISPLPEELDGIHLNTADLTIDFETNIGFPVKLDLQVSAINPSGESVGVEISGWDVTDSSTVVIPGAEALINHSPERFIVNGQATLGSPDVVGTVSTGQFVAGQAHINIPMVFELTEDAALDLDPERVELDVPERLQSITLFAEMDNQFEFGADVSILCAGDTLTFRAKSLAKPDTLAELTLLPERASLDSVQLEREHFDLFTDSLYVKSYIRLLGRTDEQGNPLLSRMISTDSLNVTLYATIRYLTNSHRSQE